MELTKGGFIMSGDFYDLQWEKNSKRSKKGCEVSVDKAEPDRLLLTVKGRDGKYYTQDIYSKVLEQTGRTSITKGLCNKVQDELDYATFKIDEKTGDIDWGFTL